MFEFGIGYKERLHIGVDWPHQWDYFVSAFNASERVKRVFDKVTAKRKVWLMCPQYLYESTEYPVGDVFSSDKRNEADFIAEWGSSAPVDLDAMSVCVDITGFIRPTLLFFVKYLRDRGVKRFYALYSEPTSYKKKELTEFSSAHTGEVRQVAGFEGIHTTSTDNDLLIVGSGYDSEELARVAYSKDTARKIQILGLPSLRADMYQENELRVALAEDAIGSGKVFFAPAYDPFVTADTLDEVVREASNKNGISNLYLAPLSSKPQVLGFALYYLKKCAGGPASVIFPIANCYAKETSVGIARVWQYTVEF